MGASRAFARRGAAVAPGDDDDDDDDDDDAFDDGVFRDARGGDEARDATDARETSS